MPKPRTFANAEFHLAHDIAEAMKDAGLYRHKGNQEALNGCAWDVMVALERKGWTIIPPDIALCPCRAEMRPAGSLVQTVGDDAPLG
jgi:hypothetical protein